MNTTTNSPVNATITDDYINRVGYARKNKHLTETFFVDFTSTTLGLALGLLLLLISIRASPTFRKNLWNIRAGIKNGIKRSVQHVKRWLGLKNSRDTTTFDDDYDQQPLEEINNDDDKDDGDDNDEENEGKDELLPVAAGMTTAILQDNNSDHQSQSNAMSGGDDVDSDVGSEASPSIWLSLWQYVPGTLRNILSTRGMDQSDGDTAGGGVDSSGSSSVGSGGGTGVSVVSGSIDIGGSSSEDIRKFNDNDKSGGINGRMDRLDGHAPKTSRMSEYYPGGVRNASLSINSSPVPRVGGSDHRTFTSPRSFPPRPPSAREAVDDTNTSGDTSRAQNMIHRIVNRSTADDAPFTPASQPHASI